MGEQDGIMDDNGLVGTVSGNDLPDMESPAEGENGTGDPVDQPAEPGDPSEGTEQEPGNDTPDQDKEEQEAQPSQSVVIMEDGESKEWREDITQRLTEMMEPEDTTDVTERLDALIDLLTPEEAEGEPEAYAAALSFEDYAEWDYPVTMQFMVYPYGAGYWMDQTEHCQDADSFLARYDEIVGLCGEGGTLKDFSVKYIYDCNGDLMYDYEAQAPEPEPGPGDGEQKETVELLLSHLEGINTTLSGMVQADAEYCQMVKDYEAEMLEMQAASTATDIFICIGVFAVFGALVFQQFLGRFGQ